jgi:hypothetical protein
LRPRGRECKVNHCGRPAGQALAQSAGYESVCEITSVRRSARRSLGYAHGDLVPRAYRLAFELLSEALPQRWAHVQGVARRSRAAATLFNQVERGLLVAASLLHDVGYAPKIARTGVSADVTDEDQVTQLVEQVTRQLGPIEVLVTNATGPQPDVAVEDFTWQTHLDQLLYFVKSPTLLLQAVLPTMKARRRADGSSTLAPTASPRRHPRSRPTSSRKPPSSPSPAVGLVNSDLPTSPSISWRRDGFPSSDTPTCPRPTFSGTPRTYRWHASGHSTTSQAPCVSWLRRPPRSSSVSRSPSTAATPSADRTTRDRPY